MFEFFIGLAIALVFLYSWLSGWWFARVLVWLALTAWETAIWFHTPFADPVYPVIFSVCGSIGAWFVSAIPLYLRAIRVPVVEVASKDEPFVPRGPVTGVYGSRTSDCSPFPGQSLAPRYHRGCD